LAVGGFINSGNNERIRIYNYPTGKLQRILKSHTDVVHDLSFSLDGAYLISGSGDTIAKIWSVRDNFTLYDTIPFHTNDVYMMSVNSSLKNFLKVQLLLKYYKIGYINISKFKRN